ncbi:MAG TPA: UbiX family flavin prenyltransferase [Saprospiraceae bacterium]|nr:UbiX family flavin prenyltransferase [Saprospiraceae bacterium]
MKIVVGISGSSGSVYARVLLQKLKTISDCEVSIVLSKNALVNWKLENPNFNIENLGFQLYSNDDFNAPFASGSTKFDAMIICPCSAGFLARVAHGISSDLMSRAADVMLKERRKIVFLFRETPFSLIHLENMKMITLAGGIVCPAIPSFYSNPSSIEELVATVSDRVLDLVGMNIDTFRWNS